MSRVVNVEQTLHGYKDGHRLLASSVKPDAASARSMLVLSDMLTSVLRGGEESYVSGYPLLPLGKYVIARTWLATELPRPGCVWTHSLLLDRETLASASSLLPAILSSHRRPSPQGQQAEYAVALNVDVPIEEQLADRLSRPRASELVRALYGTDEPCVVVSASHSDGGTREDEELACVLLEQMLPTLRDGFFFCTRTAGSIQNRDFKVVLLMDVASALRQSPSPSVDDRYEAGLRRLIQDLFPATSHPLRPFVSEYAFDFPDPRRSMRILAFVYEALMKKSEVRLDILSQLIQEECAAPEVGRKLKLALVSWQFDQLYSFRSPLALRDRLKVVGGLKLFASRAEVAQSAEKLVAEDLESAVQGAHQFRKGTFGAAVFRFACEQAAPDALAGVPCGIEIKSKIALRRPQVLEYEEFWSEIVEGKHTLLEALIKGKRVRTAEDFQRIFRGLGTAVLAGDVETFLSAEKAVCSSFLRQVVIENSSTHGILTSSPVLLRRLIDLSSRSPEEDIEILGSIADGAPAEMKIDWRCWQMVAVRSDLDLSRSSALSLASVLFKAGLRGEMPEAVALLRASLDSLHEAARRDDVPRRIKKGLIPYLPDLGYFHNWDFCARLRGAVLRLCLEDGDIHPSLLRITRSRSTWRCLFKELRGLHNGTAFLKRLKKAAKKQRDLDESMVEDLEKAVERADYWL